MTNAPPSTQPFTYAVCLNELGSETVHHYVGQEPSGRMFNELSLDFNSKHQTVNCLILFHRQAPQPTVEQRRHHVGLDPPEPGEA